MGLLRYLKGEEPGRLEAWLHGGNEGENSGSFGEYLLQYALTHDNVPGYCAAAADLYIPMGHETAQIDAVLVHEKGIIVFESKNYSGTVYGEKDDASWTQVLGGKSTRFYNPLRQNRSHIRALAAWLGVREKDMLSFVVFSERCTVKAGHGRREAVVRLPQMLKKLRHMLRFRKLYYSRGEIDAMLKKLRTAEGASGIGRIRHVLQVKRRLKLGTCPLCGAPLVRREGRWGSFIGCSAYPSCRYTRPH